MAFKVVHVFFKKSLDLTDRNLSNHDLKNFNSNASSILVDVNIYNL